MENKTKIGLITVVLVFVYLIFINFIAYIHYTNSLESLVETQKNIILSGDVGVGVNDNLDVKVIRKRFYGTFTKDAGENKSFTNLRLFNRIRIPWEVNNTPYYFAHFLFFMAILIWASISIMNEGRLEYE